MIKVSESKILSQLPIAIEKVNKKLAIEIKYAINNGYSIESIYKLVKNSISSDEEAKLIESLTDLYSDKIILTCEKSIKVRTNEEKNIFAYIENYFDIPLRFNIELNSKEGNLNLLLDEKTKENVQELSKTILIDNNSKQRVRFIVKSDKKLESTLYWIVSIESFPYIRKIDKTGVIVE
ncbi:MAG: hypothetical protein QXV12_00405 [Candidatus Rehaiarchaeum fermentans]|nr:hypothetical protein [Candidatus Rehaiarchaeum fermentans]MCW1293728.1 hypothetical protein [Candidatus Rehaiarchaeum fermentans]